ncbi:L-rhamnose-1-dehydrogenase [[Candida] railenensis]|uniref:L-rhamnose-1-dehydrogenase n=1 Tax=[Candida] railenensis TaxID=45579 RepID=A0A9P0QQ30_9ASCO|nr:L-rhamnose-1-dehydrogenase [[Candida] railenensis]
MIGRKCLVTGASQGIGYAISHKLASMGAIVTLVARNEEKLQRNLETLPGMNDDTPHSYVKYDLNDLLKDSSDDKNPEGNYAKILSKLSETSVLLNCAGVTTHSLLSKTSTSDIHSVLNVNLIAPIILSKLAYKSMLISANTDSAPYSPSIINISSILSFTGTTIPGTSVYAASKAGLLGFTQSLADEFKGKVRVNSILPGLISETDMGSKVNSSKLDVKPVPLDTVSEAIVQTILNDAINGECIVVDGKGERKLKAY